MHTTATNPALAGVLRYSTAYTLSIEALHTLCCENGNLRSRLAAIDSEYYSLRANDLPDHGSIRSNFASLCSMATESPPSHGDDGRLAATLSAIRYTKLKKIAQFVWDVHREFSEYMQGDT